MGLASILFKDPLVFAMLVVPLLYSVILHEVSHGVVALVFGDRTAKNAGRLTLSPLPHIDPMGALLLFLVGFGWAKPVPVDYGNLKSRRFGMIAVALAGCAMNVLLAFVALALLRTPEVQANPPVFAFFTILARINILLAAFNLIPIPPLDGSKVLMGFLPQRAWGPFESLGRYGLVFLILLLMSGFLDPLIRFLERLVFSFIS